MSRPQMCGILQKPPFGHQSNKLSKRFFVVLDGFLMYYPETEKKEFAKKNVISIHPKGIVPLGGCSIQQMSLPVYPFCIRIKNEETTSEFVLAADSEFERDKWITALSESSRITFTNAQIGDAMIRKLEQTGVQTAMEKQECIDKLKREEETSQTHKQRADDLHRINEELEKEKKKAQAMVAAIQQEYELVKEELGQTSDALETMEDAKEELQHATANLKQNLQTLEFEKEEIEQNLQKEKKTAEGLHRQNSNLTQTYEDMIRKLNEINSSMESVKHDKEAAERRLKEHEDASKVLRAEKDTFYEHANKLAASLKELSEEKESKEAELRVEIAARLEAEGRLRDAEKSLSELEKQIKGSKQETEEAREAMMLSVKYLKAFFENLAFESRIEADKTSMIKRSMLARRAALDRRAKTICSRSSGRNNASKNKRQPISPRMLSPGDSRVTANGENNPIYVNQISQSAVDAFEETSSSPDSIQRNGPRLVLKNPSTRHSVNVCLSGLNAS